MKRGSYIFTNRVILIKSLTGLKNTIYQFILFQSERISFILEYNVFKKNLEREEVSLFPYRSLLGCLSFIANCTRSNISYTINMFDQYQNNPGMIRWSDLFKCLGYVCYTTNLKFSLSSQEIQIITHTDANIAANRGDCTSMGGQLVKLDKSAIAW